MVSQEAVTYKKYLQTFDLSECFLARTKYNPLYFEESYINHWVFHLFLTKKPYDMLKSGKYLVSIDVAIWIIPLWRVLGKSLRIMKSEFNTLFCYQLREWSWVSLGPFLIHKIVNWTIYQRTYIIDHYHYHLKLLTQHCPVRITLV